MHIPIIRPVESASDYYNRGHFMDVNIGWPGKVHDARVFANSSLYNKCMKGTFVPKRPKIIEGVEVPLLILGDPAYPLLPWLMKPYIENSSITSRERNYNYRQSRARMVVENAFGRLKRRWQCLLKRMDTHMQCSKHCCFMCGVAQYLWDVWWPLPKWVGCTGGNCWQKYKHISKHIYQLCNSL